MPTTKADEKLPENEVEERAIIRFCQICGSQMNQEMRYGFLCWVCPECDFDEPV